MLLAAHGSTIWPVSSEPHEDEAPEEPLAEDSPPGESSPEDLRTIKMDVPLPGPAPGEDELRTLKLDVPIPGAPEGSGSDLAAQHPPRQRRPSEDDLHTLKLDAPVSSDSEEAPTVRPQNFRVQEAVGAPTPESRPISGVFDAQSATIKTDAPTPFSAHSATIKTDVKGKPIAGEATLPPKGGEGIPPTDPGSSSGDSASGSSKGSLRSKSVRRSKQLKEGEVYAGKYELLNEIARGGMGVVYRARQVDLNRMVALKVMLAGNYATEDDRRRFILEAEASARLKHPNIVPVYEIGEVEGNLYFTMDYVDGVPLSDRYGDLDRRQLHDVMIKVCAGVAYAHQRGIIHRDLKPQNVMMTKEDVPLIMDFGLAKQVEIMDAEGNPDSRTREGQVMGTPHYMPPEQAEGLISEIDIRSDVWALGVILYQLYTGELPFQGRGISELMLNIFDRDPKPPRQLDPTIDPDLEAIILKALEKPKDKRYESAGALQQDLERLLEGLPISARRATTLYRLQKWAKRNRSGLAVGTVFVIAVSILGGFGLYQFREGRRQREAAEAERRETEIKDYLGVVAAVEADQKAVASAVGVTSQTAQSLFSNGEAWSKRRAPAVSLEGRAAQQLNEVAALGERLVRFRGAAELEVMAEDENHAAIQAARANERALEEGRGELRNQLFGIRARLGRLRAAHAALAEAEDASKALASQAQVAASELAAAMVSTSEGPSWKTLAAAIEHYRAEGLQLEEGARASTKVAPAEAAFKGSADAQRRRLFLILSQAEPGSPEQEAAQESLGTLQASERVVAQARARQADESLAARAASESRRLLGFLEQAAKAGAASIKPELRLQGARLAQALAQRGLEAPLESERLAPLRELSCVASYRYAEVLLDLRAYPIYLAEISHRQAFRPQDLERLDARYKDALNNRAALGEQLEELMQDVANQPIAVLTTRLTTLASLEEGVKGESGLERRWREVEDALRRARAESAIKRLSAAEATAQRETDASTKDERALRLSALVERWRGVISLSRELSELLAPGQAQQAGAKAKAAIGQLYLERAQDLERPNAPEATKLARSAVKALTSVEAAKDSLQTARDLLRRLDQSSGAPEGMAVMDPRQLRLGGGPGDRNPPRTVTIEAFYLGLREVTNEDYLRFYRESQEKHQLGLPHGWIDGQPRAGTGGLPVTGVTYREAKLYAAAIGFRLPTDAEWEYAARFAKSSEGGLRPFPQQAYPWGSDWDPDALSETLLPPGSRPRDMNDRRILDLAGNASEWVTVREDGQELPAARGASYLYPFKRIARAGHRLRPRADYRGPQLGFRLAKDAAGGAK
jgi:formylglycine-generating enzyme required for sulfatase activity/predicted Ser/Thr protein kinase